MRMLVIAGAAALAGVVLALVLHSAAAPPSRFREVQCVSYGRSVPFLTGPGLVPARDLCTHGRVEP